MKANSLKGMNNKARLIDRQILKGKKKRMHEHDKILLTRAENTSDPRQKNFDERETREQKQTALGDRPAFPTNARMFSEAQGLTKREYFAIKAMQGILSGRICESLYPPLEVAEWAIDQADAMIKKLET